MQIENTFEVPQSVEECWAFFQDIPGVASCLPGANLDREVSEDEYEGTVVIALGPVRMEFAGRAEIVEQDEANRTITVRANGADKKGRGQAAMDIRARMEPTANGTRVYLEQDLQLAGAAAQYGRGMVSDVNRVLVDDFVDNMKATLEGEELGKARSAGGFMIGLRAAWMALKRVAARFFLPYDPARV